MDFLGVMGFLLDINGGLLLGKGDSPIFHIGEGKPNRIGILIPCNHWDLFEFYFLNFVPW